MATGTNEFQFALLTCPDHSNQALFSYCNTCKKRICEICLKGDHKEHDWTSMSNYARKIRLEATKKSEKIRTEILPNLNSNTAKARKESNRKEIIQTGRDFKEAIDVYMRYLLSNVDEERDDDQEMEIKIDGLMKLATFFEDHIQIAHDNVVVEMEEEFNKKLEEYQQISKTVSKLTTFQKGPIVEETMKYMFGRLASGGKDKQLYARSVSYVRFGTQMIFSMIATAENTVWIHPFCSEMNVLIDNTGEVIEQIDYKRKYGNAIIEGKRHIITSYSDKAVVESTESGLVTVYSTVPFIPSSVCQSRGGGLLVSLIEGDRSDITSLTKGEVHHVDLKGNLIKRYAKEKDSDSALYTWPHKVAQNVNLDLCVLDSTTGKEGNILKIISVDGRLRFTYSGHPGMETGFSAGDVVCDSTGRILLTDHLNNNIHVLSADGDFLHYLIKAQDDLREPCSLSLHDDTLWVGCRNGAIRNYRIKLK